MADLLSQVEARIDAILAEGRGVNGALGSDAQARAIPAGTFRKVADNAPLDEQQADAALYDRAYVLRFVAVEDDPSHNNPMQGPQFEHYTLEVHVGYVQGTAMSAFVDPVGGEVAATEVARADRRAMSDSRRIKVALEFGPLRGTDTDPVMVACTRTSGRYIEGSAGRSRGLTTFDLVLQSTVTSQYGP